jgi:hypothetical protein
VIHTARWLAIILRTLDVYRLTPDLNRHTDAAGTPHGC